MRFSGQNLTSFWKISNYFVHYFAICWKFMRFLQSLSLDIKLLLLSILFSYYLFIYGLVSKSCSVFVKMVNSEEIGGEA